MASSSSATLHPPRLAAIFAGSPSAPGTPVHSIQTMRRKAAGHAGPLTKILVANRGVSTISPSVMSISLIRYYPRYMRLRKSPFVSSERLTSWPCTLSRSTHMRIDYLLIVKRFHVFGYCSFITILISLPQSPMKLIKWAKASPQSLHI